MVSHLWFLINLLVYFALATLLARFTAEPTLRCGQLPGYLVNRLGLISSLLLLPLVSIAVLALNKVGFPLYSTLFGVWDTYSLLRYLPWFVFGALLAGDPRLLRSIVEVNPVLLLAILSLALLAETLIGESGGWIALIGVEYTQSLIALASIVALTIALTLGIRRWKISPSPLLKQLFNGK